MPTRLHLSSSDNGNETKLTHCCAINLTHGCDVRSGTCVNLVDVNVLNLIRFCELGRKLCCSAVEVTLRKNEFGTGCDKVFMDMVDAQLDYLTCIGRTCIRD